MSAADIIDAVIGREGRYSDNPADAGGPTMWGITEKTARKHGYTGLMRDLPRPMAVAIYSAEYILAPAFDRVLALSEAIGEELIDTGVNMGPAVASQWLQRILNALNQRGALYSDLVVDGAIGPASIAALGKLLQRRGADGEKVVLRALNCLQGARYIELTESRPANEDFVFGWLLNRVEVK